MIFSGANIALVIAVLFLVAVIYFAYRYSPRKIKTNKFEAQWKKIQAYCRTKQTWPKALEEADKLLEKALNKRRFKGKSMGEKMVSAQRLFTDNDSLWFAHNLYKKILAGTKKTIKEAEVKDALIGYRQALRDLGALTNGSKK